MVNSFITCKADLFITATNCFSIRHALTFKEL
nr:MAG TPA: hypothetical protein [Bacteriophage sp.]